ncbi:MAG: thiamine pyrophosphate-binding protein [Candidatus Limnocylindrales bacterium]
MLAVSCADYIAEALIAAGVRYVAGIPGHGNLVFEDAILKRSDRIGWILVRHEQSAAHLADGYFRASGRPLAITTSVGPGALNTLIGVATAYADSTAMVVVTGTPPTYLYGRGCLQEIERQYWSDFPSVIRPLVKRSWQVQRADQFPGVVAQLIKIAVTGRPGPVHLDFPMDIQAAPCDADVPDPALHSVAPLVRPDASAVQRAAALLAAAQRPLILAGGGVINAGAHNELRELAECLGSPVINTLHGKGALPDDHPLSGRTCGSKGTTCANALARNADVILAVGTRFGEWDTSSWKPGATFAIPPTRLIHLDIDDRELAKNYPTEVSLWGDAKAGLADLLAAVRERTRGVDRPTSPWVARLEVWRAEWLACLDDQAKSGPVISTTLALRRLREAMPRESVVTGAAGHAQAQMFSEWETYEPRTHLSSSHFSTMGFALPAAIGAKLALPDRPVVAIMGDGDFQQSLPELATAVQYGVPVVAVVLNNGGLLSIRDLQIAALGSRRFGGTEFKVHGGQASSSPDFVALGRAYGVSAERVSTADEIGPALRRLVDAELPGLLEIPTASEFPDSEGMTITFFEMPVPEQTPGVLALPGKQPAPTSGR